MEITDKQVDGVVVVSLAGRLDAVTSSQLEERFNALVSPSKRHFVLELSQLDYVSSGGLRVILAMAKKLTELSGGLVLACLHPFVEDIMNMAGFNALLPTAGSEAEAIAMLGAGPA
jgi:anti-anti-sigma factor